MLHYTVNTADTFDCKTKHYSAAALQILKPIVMQAIAPNGTVLDCFCGSGTTLVAAQQAGMRWIGIDMSELAIAIAAERISREFPGVQFCRTSESQPAR